MEPFGVTVIVAASAAILKAVSSLVSTFLSVRRHESEVHVRLQGDDGTELKINASSLTPEAREKLIKLLSAMSGSAVKAPTNGEETLEVTISPPERAP
jgi:hypothetical protein